MCNSAADNMSDVRDCREVAFRVYALNSRSDGATVPCASSTVSKEEPNMGFWRIFILTLLVLGFAASANAGVQMYSAELIVHMRGSDAAGNFVGIPFGNHCNMNPYQAERTAMFSYPGIPVGTYTLTIPKFGGQIPVIDTNMDSLPDVASGCAPASLHAGLPLTGGGALATTGNTSTSRTAYNPRGFDIPKSDFSRVTSGASFLQGIDPVLGTSWFPLSNGTPRFNFEIEYADLRNASGGFSNAGGPGSFTVTHGAETAARVHVKAGKNQFGGTMRMLGQYHTNRGLKTFVTTSVGATPWNLQYIGAGASTANGVVTGGLKYTTTISRSYYYPGYFGYTPRTGIISVFPWTTGTAEVTASGAPQATILKRTGHDNRTPAGAGSIQLVSPVLARWQNPSSDYYTGSIAMMKLIFVPEPVAWLMLVGGLVTLALLYRVNHQRGRA
jgi:hypothetical protein